MLNSSAFFNITMVTSIDHVKRKNF
jgi:hypothetical protein